MAIGVLAVQGDVREHARVLTELGADVVLVRRPREIDGLDGLVIPGGESTTMDKLTRAFDLAAPLQDAIAGGLPVYGSCAGMIMLADRVADPARDRQGDPQRTLGGIDMTVRRNAFGRQRESFEVTLDFTDVGDVPAVFIRAPLAEDVGDGVQVLARTPSDAPAQHPDGPTDPEVQDTAGRIVAVRSGKLLATSFHPEVTGERRIHDLFIRIIRGEA
ncbi:pyridoxal 5'-phosphate synthase glutaminase subunit PdxT [Tersicoccus sp. Bi-70]|uniref:pyridoxal 5'-phosphate synthase glutaminase subunit PdxT n=1 Tax=Tersicoccus sp. Bi-70 TaxID=1897634 RepID=UPI000975A3A2|nr:pyridoxal 5'-phosphate synthase glutaminase subunit PdxT [Tersicoccus sp. Bi-70]OMH37007.1 glutamine amidotransferase subunit PdxT [Tersicoccus sp. Bi-70]